MPTTFSRLPASLLIAFGLVKLPLSLLMSPTAAVLPNYYLDCTAVTLAGLATATRVARLFDGLTDPLIGYLSELSGRRKPWMLAGGDPFVATGVRRPGHPLVDWFTDCRRRCGRPAGAPTRAEVASRRDLIGREASST
jgi:hypothetical protein